MSVLLLSKNTLKNMSAFLLFKIRLDTRNICFPSF
jgi:hypothetical protein